MNTGIKAGNNLYPTIGGRTRKLMLPKRPAGVTSTLVNREKGNMPQEFGKIRPIKATHSPTMTP